MPRSPRSLARSDITETLARSFRLNQGDEVLQFEWRRGTLAARGGLDRYRAGSGIGKLARWFHATVGVLSPFRLGSLCASLFLDNFARSCRPRGCLSSFCFSISINGAT